MIPRRLRRAFVAAFLALASLVSLAVPASADGGVCLPDDPDCVPDDEPPTEPPPAYVAKPDLRITSASARATTDGTASWELTYTIGNVGDASAPSSTTTFRRENAVALGSASAPSLAAGATTTKTVVVPRAGCWDAVRINADANGVVAEHSELNNHSWVIGISTWPCADAARYSVRLVSMKANTAQENADEPYLVYSSANDATGTTRSTTPLSGVITGETVYPFQSDRCVFGAGSDCTGLPALNGIGIAAELMEHDSGDLTKVRETIAEAFDKAGLIGTVLLTHWLGAVGPWVDEAIDEVLSWFDDDEIGTNVWGYSPTDLANRLPQAGTSFQETRAFYGGGESAGAHYWVTLEVTRTA